MSRGLKYSAVGPVDVTRGALGLGVDGAQSSAAWIGDVYRRSRLKDQLRQELAAAQDTIASELAAAQEVVANLPEALQKARGRRRRRPLLLAVLGVGVLAGERWRSRSCGVHQRRSRRRCSRVCQSRRGLNCLRAWGIECLSGA